MKKLFALVTTLLLSMSAHAAQFSPAEHYKVLDLELSKKPIVTEFFSFYCPHCKTFDPIIRQLKAQLPEGVKLNKAHVSLMGGAMGKEMNKAFATMVVLKIENKMAPVMFNRIQTMRKAPNSAEEIRQIFLDEGIDAKKFDATYNGFTVDSMARRYDKQFTDAGLSGVPAVLVNNKYLVQAQSIESVDQYYALINYLLTLK